ncbi:MAG TPA: hypothetical protein VNS63_14695 [Blastocatellia bacterium]|nr:hypothetical protein [Blastocatellia bacterium]
MILFRLTSLLAAMLMVGFDLSAQAPSAAKQNYPAVIKDSTERRAHAEREWRRMLDAYSIPQTPPDLYPITYTPRSLLGVTGGIKMISFTPEPGSEAVALREAIRRFLDRWRELLGAEPAAVSLVSGDESGDTRRLTYKQANYAFPIAGNAGEMVAVVSRDGRLLQLDSRFIPVVEMPARPSIDRDSAAKKVVGRNFTYSDIAGHEQRAQIGGLDEVVVKRLVVLPIEKADSTEVHLAWEIVAGKQLSWTIYVDAISGQELKVSQNFQT